MGAKVATLHIHDVNPHVTHDGEGTDRVVESMCGHYYPANRVVSVADFHEWVEIKRYTTETFCGHCRRVLTS